MKTIKLSQLLEYLDCPNIAKYGQGRSYSPYWLNRLSKQVMMSCYRDIANYERIVTWKTLRKRTTELLGTHLAKFKDMQQYQQQVINVLSGIRTWYLNHFSDLPVSAVVDLQIEAVVPSIDVKLQVPVDAVVFHPEAIELVLIGEGRLSEEELLNNHRVRTVLWALNKQEVKPHFITYVGIERQIVVVTTTELGDYENLLMTTERVLVLTAGAIKHKLYYPVNNERCSSCKYKSICRW